MEKTTPQNIKIELKEDERKRKFIDYYGINAKKLVDILDQDKNNSKLLESVIKYGMHLPDTAGDINRKELESRASTLFKKSVDIIEMINEVNTFF